MKRVKPTFLQLLFNIVFFNILINGAVFIQKSEAKTVTDYEESSLFREGDYPKLYINEFVASNSNSLYDEKTKSYPDWVEIYNPNNFDVDLSGYFLSDNPNKITKHQLSVSSDLIIPAKGFTVLFADGNEKVSALHLSFSLSASGESILLTAPDGITIIDSITFEEQSTDISYGRESDGINNWVFFSMTTPNQTNSFGEISNISISNPPIFSRVGGVYENTFPLELSSSKPEASIFYTIDGSEPKIENLGGTTYEYKQSYHPNNVFYRAPSLHHNINTYTYDSPIDLSLLQEKDLRISDVNAELRINGTTPPVVRNNAVVIRAIAIEPEKEASDIITQTYFFDKENFTSNNLAAISISLNEDQFVGFKDGIYVPGEDYEKSIIPGLLSPANYRREGIEAEIPANFEIYENGIKTVNEKVGFRIHGNITRNFVPRSFRIYARKEYGNKEINYPIFKGNSYDKYKRIILRNSGQDYNQSYFKDAMIQSLMSFTNIDYQNYRPFNVYINGEYWGILNARERIDKHYLKYKYDLNEENVDILENALTINVKEGDASNYNSLVSQINNTNPSSNEFVPLVTKHIDIDNFIDYHILETYANNNDWPTNNVIFWRYKTNQEPTSQKSATDGRWRWALVDIDLGFQQQSINNNHINRLLTDRTFSTQIFRRLMQNSEIKSQFITRYTDLLNTAFKPERVLDEIERFENLLDQDFADHIQRWNKPNSLEGWQNNIENLRKFANQRQDISFKNIKNSFNLKELESVSVDVDDYNKGYIKVNTIEIDTTTPGVDKNTIYPWTGQYFKERLIQFVALPPGQTHTFPSKLRV